MHDWVVLALLVPAVVAPIVLLMGFAGCSFQSQAIPYTPQLEVESKTSDSVTLKWFVDPTADRIVFERANLTLPTEADHNFELPSSNGMVTDATLTPNTTYRYTARFKYPDGSYSPTDSIEVTTPSAPVVRPTFDALGFGPSSTGGTSATISWTHTPVGSQVAVAVAVRWSHSSVGPGTVTRAASYGGTAMTSSGVIGLNGATPNAADGEFQEIFTIVSAPAGPRQVQVTVNRNFTQSITLEGCSLSYVQAANFVPVAAVTGSEAGSALAQSVASLDNETVLQMFGASTGAIGSYSQTLRHQGTIKSFVVGDASGTAAVEFTATRQDGVDYAGSALRITPSP